MNMLIYIADTDVLEDRELFEKKLLLISPERRAALAKLRFDKDRRLSLGAGLLFNKALAGFGIDAAKACIVRGEHGKPNLKEYPEVFFNLSHSESRAMCVVSDCEAGCDVERITGSRIRVAERFFTAEEQNYINAGSAGEEERFFRIWTLKESFIKATGGGLSVPLNSFTVRVSENEAVLIREGEQYSFYEPELNDGYRYACCTKGGQIAEPEVIIEDLSCL